jgi:hypothetical protein
MQKLLMLWENFMQRTKILAGKGKTKSKHLTGKTLK